MVKALHKKIKSLFITAFIITISIFTIYLCTSSFNRLGTSCSKYIEVNNGETLIIPQLMDSIYNLDFNETGEEISYKTLKIEKNQKKSNLQRTFLLDYMKNPYALYVDGELISQNTKPTEPNYNPSLSFITFSLTDHGEHIVELVGENLQYITWFFGNHGTIESYVQIRVVIYTAIMMLYIGLALLCLVLFIYNSKSVYFLLLSIVGFISAFKILILYEIHFLSGFLDITIWNFHMYNVFTSLLNMILPLYILGYLYDIKPKKSWVILTGVMYIIACFACLDIQIFNRTFMIILGLLTVIGLIIQAYGIYYKKPYWVIMLINNILYSSTGFYKNAMDSFRLPKTIMDGLFHITYVGAMIYLFIFVSIFLVKYIGDVKQLKKKKEDFDKVYMLRGISHDLKHPLAVMKSGNQIMEKYDLPRRDYMKYIQANLKANRQLENMVNNISVYLNGKETEYDGHAPLLEVMDNAIEQFSIFCESSNKVFEVLYKGDIENIVIPLKPIVLYRILFNIFDNANKYSREGSKIELVIEKSDKVIIIFKDSGIGMSPSKVEEVFQPFYRIDESRSEEGLGLGLSVVKNILDKIDGEIKIFSEVGKGTYVFLHFPYEECST